jgi:hypothetical protein
MTKTTLTFAAALAAVGFIGFAGQASAAPAPVVAAPQDAGLVQNVDYQRRWWRNYYKGKYGTDHVRAPFTSVDSGRDTYVRAPFARVYDGRGGTWVRAPFVNLFVPR